MPPAGFEYALTVVREVQRQRVFPDPCYLSCFPLEDREEFIEAVLAGAGSSVLHPGQAQEVFVNDCGEVWARVRAA